MEQPERPIDRLAHEARSQETALLTPYIHPRRIGLKIVSNQELVDIGSLSAETAFYFMLLGICAGGLIASIAALTTVEITSAFVWAGWVAGLIISALGTVALGFLSYFSWRKRKARIAVIDSESTARQIGL